MGCSCREEPRKCDDGNIRNGDGCSSECVVEKGYACSASTQVLGGKMVLPILYRDMKRAADAGGHPDFQPATHQQLERR